MLQQTQVATVLSYYKEWLRRFPDFPTLAAAAESDVLYAWQGLGYYARARNLHAAAKAIVSRQSGIFPADVTAMRALPGLGRYTANAVATFAFEQSVPVVEANIARLLARLINLQLTIDSAAGTAAVWTLAGALIPKRRASQFNSALMDLGALICTARQPKCGQCPVRKFCAAIDPASLPRKRARTPTKLLTENHAFTLRRGRVLLEQSQKRWRGMWMLPRLTRTSKPAPVYRAEFPFTHHRITLTVFTAPPAATPHRKWFSPSQIETLPIPSPHRRALRALLNS